MSREQLHILANEFVNELEESNLARLFKTMSSLPINSKQRQIVNEQMGDEMHRIFTNDEDHEVVRDLNEKYKRWFNGDDIDGIV